MSSIEEAHLKRQKDLQALASHLTLSEERQRREIAREVHDTIGQNLTALALRLEMLKRSEASPRLHAAVDELFQMVQESLVSTRSCVFQLSSPLLYEYGLAPAIECLVQDFATRFGLAFSFTADDAPKPVKRATGTFLYRGVRELLYNVAKHAKARRVDVSVIRDGDDVVVQVEDDGIGFQIHNSNQHPSEAPAFGLLSIREHLASVGGSIQVEPRPDAGSRIILLAPVSSESTNT